MKCREPNVDLHYLDPRLVALYDTDNPHGADTDFYLRLASKIGAQRIIDLGCGTGLLTRQLAVSDWWVVGVDPAPAMLAFARQQPQAERVEWREGDSRVLGTPQADLALMTGNVAQVFLEDDDWAAALSDLHVALAVGGVLAFESRNPERREWETWHRDATFERLNTPDGPLETWLDVTHASQGRVSMLGHNVFTETGEDLVVGSELRFRSHEELITSLTDVGFGIEHIYGDWLGGPVTPTSPIMVFVARRLDRR
ncbi:class I SAM-dependent methyltransferase [Deinococcus detaillensis]|uniref:Class I SAM-dependent methyltransferase n=1 Tax=Deinococcus detaillensis TaxID=2592048 RepID=A0A553V4N0_9DEIO|nr:class I SAM-dependent methyltransferase [Deinococcus detaillensis]TSA87415.1 class I SAM-dependent methyltransferase [Deinococcus detaillensis]